MKPAFIVIILGVSGVYSDDTVLKVTPTGIAVQPGETISLRCQHFPQNLNEDLKLEWFMPDETIPISELISNQSAINITNSNILRYKSENGTLTIQNATFADTGTYKCKKDDLEIETVVKVYTMPSYTTEIIVVLVINAVLVVIFMGCSILTYIRDRNNDKTAMRKQKLGHKTMTTSKTS